MCPCFSWCCTNVHMLFSWVFCLSLQRTPIYCTCDMLSRKLCYLCYNLYVRLWVYWSGSIVFDIGCGIDEGALVAPTTRLTFACRGLAFPVLVHSCFNKYFAQVGRLTIWNNRWLWKYVTGVVILLQNLPVFIDDGW